MPQSGPWWEAQRTCLAQGTCSHAVSLRLCSGLWVKGDETMVLEGQTELIQLPPGACFGLLVGAQGEEQASLWKRALFAFPY